MRQGKRNSRILIRLLIRRIRDDEKEEIDLDLDLG